MLYSRLKTSYKESFSSQKAFSFLYFSKDGQAWGFPVVNPEKMYNEDGSLGDAGKLMKALYLKMFKENPGGVRIDHLVGLIDPWVYKKGCKPKIEEGAGRLYSSPHHDELKKYADFITDTVENDGFVKAVEKYIDTKSYI